MKDLIKWNGTIYGNSVYLNNQKVLVSDFVKQAKGYVKTIINEAKTFFMNAEGYSKNKEKQITRFDEMIDYVDKANFNNSILSETYYNISDIYDVYNNFSLYSKNQTNILYDKISIRVIQFFIDNKYNLKEEL